MGKELDVAKKAALAGAREAMRYYRKLRAGDIRLKEPGDVVTAADVAAERAIISVIRKHFPHDGIIGEESGFSKTSTKSSGRFWAVDPIDGTTNFMKGLDVFAVCVAAFREHEPIAGAVYLPVQKKMYAAEKGRGASCNGKPIAVSREQKLSESFLFLSVRFSDLRRNAAVLAPRMTRLILSVSNARLFNSWAADLCLVAEGRADGAVSTLVKLWDFAAAALIVEEAGGTVTDDEGRGWHGYLSPEKKEVRLAASNGKIHKKLLDTIAKAGGDNRP